MTRTILGGSLAILLAASAFSASAQPAASDAPSARKLALARQLIEATGIGATLSGTMHDMVGKAYATLAPAPSAEAEARRQVYEEAQADATARMTPKMIDMMVDSYARYFTEQELSDSIAFYRSPSGRSMMAKMPQLMHGVTANVVALLPDMRRDMGEEVCAKVTCTPAERTAFFGEASAKP